MSTVDLSKIGQKLITSFEIVQYKVQDWQQCFTKLKSECLEHVLRQEPNIYDDDEKLQDELLPQIELAHERVVNVDY